MSDDVPTIIDLVPQDAAENAAAPVVLGDEADVVVIKPETEDAKKLPDRAIEHDDGSIELPLFVPVVLRWKSTEGGEIKTDPPVNSVTFRRLNGKDVRTVLSSGEGDKFFAELTAASVRAQFPMKHKWLNILDRMDGADSAACIRIAQHFLENGPKTPGR